MNATQRLLIVDDEHNIRAGLAAALAGDGRIIDSASNGAEALAAVENAGRYDIVVTDLKMPGKVGGLELVRRIRQKTPDAAIIVITAYGTVETAVEAMKLGAFDYLSKPIDIKHLRTVVRNALEKQKLLGENRLLRRRLSGEREIIAAAGEMRKVFDVVAQVAASDVTVLRGVSIGEHSIVGACSLVTRDVPPHSVAFGQPAEARGKVGDRSNAR